jgi:selenocysteine lyase/cysteine desulfurase
MRPFEVTERWNVEQANEVDRAFERGAAVAFGLMGMAEAIRATEHEREIDRYRARENEAYDRAMMKIWG